MSEKQKTVQPIATTTAADLEQFRPEAEKLVAVEGESRSVETIMEDLLLKKMISDDEEAAAAVKGEGKKAGGGGVVAQNPTPQQQRPPQLRTRELPRPIEGDDPFSENLRRWCRAEDGHLRYGWCMFCRRPHWVDEMKFIIGDAQQIAAAMATLKERAKAAGRPVDEKELRTKLYVTSMVGRIFAVRNSNPVGKEFKSHERPSAFQFFIASAVCNGEAIRFTRVKSDGPVREQFVRVNCAGAAERKHAALVDMEELVFLLMVDADAAEVAARRLQASNQQVSEEAEKFVARQLRRGDEHRSKLLGPGERVITVNPLAEIKRRSSLTARAGLDGGEVVDAVSTPTAASGNGAGERRHDRERPVTTNLGDAGIKGVKAKKGGGKVRRPREE